MKKELLSAIGAALVAGFILLLILLPSNTTPPATTGPTVPSVPGSTPSAGTSTAGTSATTNIPTTVTYPPPTTSIVVTPTGTSVVTSPRPTRPDLPEEPGVVRLYTCDPALQVIYTELAAEYYIETGTQVVVMGPGEGSCEETLTALLAGEEAPTLFCIHSRQMFETLQNRLYDLSGTQAAQQLYGEAFALQANGSVLALAADVAGSGLIYNAALLASPVGFTQTDFHNFADLQYIVNYITSNRSRLNVYAFAAPDFKDTHLMEHLAGIHANSDQMRSFMDLYLKNTTQKTTTLNYFLKGTTVFYIGGTRDYDTIASLGHNKLGFLPAYAEGSNTVQCFSSHYWAVSNQAREADIQVTVDFLGWLVTAQGDTAPVDRLELLAPYQGATFAANILQRQLRTYIATGDAQLFWSVCGNVTDMDAFVVALQAYKADPSDENWAVLAALLQ